MQITIEEPSYLSELIIELIQRYDNQLNIYPQEWLVREGGHYDD